MLGDSKSALVAVLLAYCAMAAPVPAGEHGYVLQVVGALRAKMDLDAPDPELSIILKETENALASNGTIHGETLDRLDHNIEVCRQYHFFVLKGESSFLKLLARMKYCTIALKAVLTIGFHRRSCTRSMASASMRFPTTFPRRFPLGPPLRSWTRGRP